MDAPLWLMNRSMPRPGWDHDHCSLCGTKTPAYEGDLRLQSAGALVDGGSRLGSSARREAD